MCRHNNTMFSLSKGGLLDSLSYVLLRIVLDASYFVFISKVFLYQGYSINISAATYSLSWFIYIFIVWCTPKKLKEPSDFFFVIFVASLIAPLSSLYGMTGWTVEPLLAATLCYFFIYFSIRYRWIKGVSFPTVKSGERIALFISIFFIFVALAWFFITGAIWNFNLNFLDVYAFREINGELINVGFFAYLNNWVYKVFSIFVFIYALKHRNGILLVFAIGVQVVLFGVSSHKSVLFYPLIVFFIYWYFKDRDRLFFYPLIMSSIIFLSLAYYLVADNLVPASMFIRRVFFVPALLAYEYWQFFQDNPHVYWSNSFLSGFLDYPYYDRITKMIGYSMGTEASSNNGFLSSGYAHAGYMGIAFYAVTISFFLMIANVMARRGGDLWVAVAILVVPLRGLVLSSDLPTTFFTHGLIVALLVLVVARKPNYE